MEICLRGGKSQWCYLHRIFGHTNCKWSKCNRRRFSWVSRKKLSSPNGVVATLTRRLCSCYSTEIARCSISCSFVWCLSTTLRRSASYSCWCVKPTTTWFSYNYRSWWSCHKYWFKTSLRGWWTRKTISSSSEVSDDFAWFAESVVPNDLNVFITVIVIARWPNFHWEDPGVHTGGVARQNTSI